MRPCTSWTSFVLLLVSGVPRSAHGEGADSVTARIEWRRETGNDCIDSAALASAVNTRWRREVFVAGDRADLVLSGIVQRASRGFAATVELTRANGESLGSRRLETASKDCRALDDSLALAVGLMLDVSRERIAEERARAQTSSERVFAGPPIAIPDTRSKAPGFAVEGWAGTEVSFGLLPATSVAGRVGVGLSPPRLLRFEIAASLSSPSEETAGPARGVELSFLAVDAGLCVDEWEAHAMRLLGCFTERFGRVRATGYGLDRPTTATELLFDVGLREVLLLRLSRVFWVRIALNGEIPLMRYRFVFDDAAQERQIAHEMSRFAAGGELGLALRWP